MLIAPPFVCAQVLYGVVRFRGEEYRVGTSIFLRPGSFKFKASASGTLTKKDSSKDQKVRVIMSDIMQTCRWLLCTGTPCLPTVQETCGKLHVVFIFRHVRKITKSNNYLRHVCPSVHMEQLGFHWMNFHEIWYLNIFLKSVEKIQFSLKVDKNNRYSAWRSMYIVGHSSLGSS